MTDTPAKAAPGWVKPTVDYLGLIAFVGVYAYTRVTGMGEQGKGDLLLASWGLAAGSAGGLIIGLVMLKKLAPLPLFTGLSAVVFAGLALIFHNDIFVKIKLTIIDSLLAGALLIGLAMGKAPLKAMLGDALKLQDGTWKKLTVRYAVFFLIVAVANEVIWRNAGEGKLWSDDVWVMFRFPGVPVLAVLFSFTQVPMMMKDLMAAEAHEEPPVPPAS